MELWTEDEIQAAVAKYVGKCGKITIPVDHKIPGKRGMIREYPDGGVGIVGPDGDEDYRIKMYIK